MERWLIIIPWLLIVVVIGGLWSSIVILRFKSLQAIEAGTADLIDSRVCLRALIDKIQVTADVNTHRGRDIEAVLRRVDALLSVWAEHWGEPAERVKAELLQAMMKSVEEKSLSSTSAQQ